MLQWLRAQAIGRALFTSDTQVVWLLPPHPNHGDNHYAAK
jgi:hypothetical protein